MRLHPTCSVAVLLLLLNDTTAFSPSFIPKTSSLGSSAFVANRGAASFRKFTNNNNKNSISMFAETSGGVEELQEVLERTERSIPLAKHVRKSPSLFKIAGLATIPISAAVGFLSTPSRRFAAHTVGGIVTGIAGAVGKSRWDTFTDEHVKPAVLQAIIDHGVNKEQTKSIIGNIQEQFGMPDQDFEAICSEVYANYLVGMIKYNPRAKISDLDELEQLKNTLSLDNLQVGEAHTLAAELWYRQVTLETTEEELADPDHPDRQALDKLLFLTERVLRRNEETEQAFRFEMTRMAKALKLDDIGEALERVAETAEPFYQRALQSARAKLGTGQVSPKMLEKARKTVGISEDTAFDMHVATFNQEVREQLGLAANDQSEEDDDAPMDYGQLVFEEESMERLEMLRDILGLSETDAEYEVSVEATPLYQATALAAMQSVLENSMTPEQAWEAMDNRRKELLLGTESTKALIASMVMQALGQPLEETNKFSKVNNEAATFSHLLEALEAKQALVAILAKSGWEEFETQFNEIFCNPWDKQSANGFLLSDERMKMYRIFLNRAALKAVDGKIDDEMHDKILQVKGLLGITDQQAEIESRTIFGKKLKGVMKQATMEIVEDYTEELANNMQQQLEAVVEGYRLSDDYVRESGSTFYAKAVELVSDKSPNGIPSDEQAEALESLRKMFKLSVDETVPAHSEFFGSVYKKSVLEAMGQTGIIRPELRDGLDKLRKRLGVSEEASKSFFLNAVEEKMKPMVEWVGSELERTLLTKKQLSQRRGKDMGEDVFQSGKGADGVLGLGAEVNIMSDIMELVDFYVENDLIEEVPSDKQNEDGETIVEKIYPVTALGMGAIDAELAELLYRQFIVGAFQSQGANTARYEESRETFAGILGLSESKKDEIGKTIGNTIYDNFISNALTTKGTMDQQDMMFIANIQGKLGLTNEQSQKMVLASQKKVLSEQLEDLLDSPSPESVKEFREKCNAMGLDLIEDVGISKQRLTRLFECEIIPGLKNGELTVENSNILGDIQESLGLDVEECEAMFESVLNTLAKNAYALIKGEILRGREENVVEKINELVRYAQFAGGELGLEVDESTGHKIVSIYEAFDLEGLSAETIEENKDLLRTACGV